VIVAPGRGALLWELKRDGAAPTPAQQRWLAALESIGWQVAVRRPADLRDGTILADLRALAALPVRPQARDLVAQAERAKIEAARAAYLRRGRDGRWTPRAAA
jgi:hypothetical protein